MFNQINSFKHVLGNHIIRYFGESTAGGKIQYLKPSQFRCIH